MSTLEPALEDVTLWRLCRNQLQRCRQCHVVHGYGYGTGGIGIDAVAEAGCDANWRHWWVGSRTQWNVTKDFYMGVDLLYQKVETASTPDGLVPLPVIPAGTNTVPGPSCQRPGQLAGPLPRPSRLLSVIT